jgi:hypothetical protein
MKKRLLLVSGVCLFLSTQSIAQTTSTAHVLPQTVTAVTSLNSQAALISQKQVQLDQAVTTSRAAVAEIKTQLSDLLTTYQGMLKSEYAKATTDLAKKELLDELQFTDKRIAELTTPQR